MSESGMRKDLVDALRTLHAVAVENGKACPGTPDINYVEGWIECKWLRSWPKKPETPVRLDHELMKDQKIWIKRRLRCGGSVWVMLRSKREWFLFSGDDAIKHLGTATKQGLIDVAVRYWPNGLNSEELIGVLTDESRLQCVSRLSRKVE